MSTRTRSYSTNQPWVVDQSSITRDHGIQVNWDYVPDSYREGIQYAQPSALAAPRATSLSVVALPAKVLTGALLNFGVLAAVNVTVNDATANAGDTALGVEALSGPIPAGVVLEFDDGKYAELTASAVAGATSLTVQALSAGITDSAVAEWPGATLTARVAAKAEAGATSITVDPIPYGIASGAKAGLPGAGGKYIPEGTVMCRLADGLGGGGVPRVARPGSETASGLLGTNAFEHEPSAALSGYEHIQGGVVNENMLPDASGDPKRLDSTIRDELQAAGTGFAWRQASNSIS